MSPETPQNHTNERGNQEKISRAVSVLVRVLMSRAAKVHEGTSKAYEHHPSGIKIIRHVTEKGTRTDLKMPGMSLTTVDREGELCTYPGAFDEDVTKALRAAIIGTNNDVGVTGTWPTIQR